MQIILYVNREETIQIDRKNMEATSQILNYKNNSKENKNMLNKK
jgi:phage-related protein